MGRALASEERLGRSEALVVALLPRGWMVLAVAALLSTFIAGAEAVALGGFLLARSGLRASRAAVSSCSAASIDRRSASSAGAAASPPRPSSTKNHVFTATFAFNLLMGREWPPGPVAVAKAIEICEELRRDELLARMPGGLLQMVGETGWQLSHGERSRLYIARGLLQRVDLMVLDGSFAALDPGTLQRALRCVLRRARAVLVIAHP